MVSDQPKVVPWHKTVDGAYNHPDGYYVEERCVYWGAGLRRPTHPSRSYVVRGEYPRARFFSFQSYHYEAPVDILCDFQIDPDEGSINPFREGQTYPADGTSVSYEIRLVEVASRDAIPVTGPANTLYVMAGPETLYILIYRVYWNEMSDHVPVPEGYTRTEWQRQGQKPVAQIIVRTAENADSQNHAPHILPEGVGSSMKKEPQSVARFLESQHRSRHQEPSAEDCFWTISSSHSMHANTAVIYLQAELDDSLGEIAVSRFKAPTFPNTDEGEGIDPHAQQTRYWSVCTHIPGTTTTIACISDYRFVVDDDGFVTVVFSAAENKPANAKNWLPYAWDEARKRYGAVVYYRHLLPSEETFPESPYFYSQACEWCYPPSAPEFLRCVGDSQAIAQFSSEYYPKTWYCSKGEFEKSGEESRLGK